MARHRTLRHAALCLAAALVLSWGGRLHAEEIAPPTEARKNALPLKLVLKLGEKKDLTLKNVKFSIFPEGRRCVFTYSGPRNPKVIQTFTEIGFRTTVYVDPNSSPDGLKALEAAGAEIGVGGFWGAKGGYSSLIEGNTVQEAYDAVVTSRVAVRKKASGPVPCASAGGHINTMYFPIARDVNYDYGAAFHDANFLLLMDNKPYMIYLGRLGTTKQMLANRENFDNRMDSDKVPNELIYYQILANQMRGTLVNVEKGQIVRFALRDFGAQDLDELKTVVGQFGKDPQIWHATEGMIASNEYIQRKVLIKEVKAADDTRVEIELALDRDAIPAYLLTPLSLQFPLTTKIESASLGGVAGKIAKQEEGVHVDVALRDALREHCQMALETAMPDMTVPDSQTATLTLKNPTGKAVEDAHLEWVNGPGLEGSLGLTATGGTDKPFSLPAQGEQKIQATLKTVKGARFGINPVAAIVRGKVDGVDRVFLESFEVLVAPMLRVEMDPMQTVALRKDREQYFSIDIANGKDPAKDGSPTRLVSHKAGPCKGALALEVPEGMKAEPAEQPFELKENDKKTLLFKVVNEAWNDKTGVVRPVVKFEGAKEAVEMACPGTPILRKQEIVEGKTLDDKGLLAVASWDDKEKGGHFDKACGPTGAYYYPGHAAAYNNEGVKAWCMNTQRVCQLHETYRNIDYMEGTLMFWMRKDPFLRNENTYNWPSREATAKMGAGRSNEGETIISACAQQRIDSSRGGLTLRRFRSYGDKKGFLQLTYQGILGQKFFCQADFPWTEEWRHVGLLWSVKDKRLELYLDGKLAAKADPGSEPWHPVPWDFGNSNTGHSFILITSDHGAQTFTCRDEVYSYNRALSPDEIAANKELVKK